MKHLPKFIFAWVTCLALRLIPFRPANAEPLLGTLMPFTKKYGMVSNLAFIVSSMVVYDVLTSGIGPWTYVTAFAYALVSVASSLYFKKVEATRIHYAGFAVIATLFYDALTGLTLGPIVHNQPFMVALMGQIPFTMSHLAGNFLIAAFLSPLIQKWVVENPALEFSLPSRRTVQA
ncbi:MAG TPA: hypothetical protein VLA04_05425 [Verrucomicrobiae bacterium]|nr:hypothetical protein [Verrucomicrobiae bacterium]